MAEFEDAMGDTFANFLRNFPHIILKEDAKYTGGEVFQVRSLPPRLRIAHRLALHTALRTPCRWANVIPQA
jgi:hypothetical protein